MHECRGETVRPELCSEQQLSSCDIPVLWFCLSHWSPSLASQGRAAAAGRPAAPVEPAQLHSPGLWSYGCTACSGPEHPYLKNSKELIYKTQYRTSIWKKKERALNSYLFWPTLWWVLPLCGWWQKAPWSSAVPGGVPILKYLQNFSDFLAAMIPRYWSWLPSDMIICNIRGKYFNTELSEMPIYSKR